MLFRSSLLGGVLTETFEIDGRAALTMKTLFRYPGMLTSEFLAGRRRRYTSPLRLYLFISIAFFVVIAWAARSFVPVYERSNVTAAHVTGISGASALDADTNARATVFVGAARTVEISGLSSNASATMVVHVIRYHQADDGTLTARSKSQLTLVADSVLNASGSFMTEASYVDGGSCDVVKILNEAPSAGTWSLWVVPVGAQGR